jgi:hypothetical protein
VPKLSDAAAIFSTDTRLSPRVFLTAAREKQQNTFSLEAAFNIRAVDEIDLGGAAREVSPMPIPSDEPRDLIADHAEAAANPTVLRVVTTPRERRRRRTLPWRQNNALMYPSWMRDPETPYGTSEPFRVSDRARRSGNLRSET